MPDMTPLQAAALWSGLLLIWLVALSLRVVLARRRHRVSLGDGGVGALSVAARGFGNASEYIPAGVGALILMGAMGFTPVAVHAVGAALLLGRLVHPFGLKPDGVTLARALGMLLTWVPLIAAGTLLIQAAFAG